MFTEPNLATIGVGLVCWVVVSIGIVGLLARAGRRRRNPYHDE